MFCYEFVRLRFNFCLKPFYLYCMEFESYLCLNRDVCYSLGVYFIHVQMRTHMQNLGLNTSASTTLYLIHARWPNIKSACYINGMHVEI